MSEGALPESIRVTLQVVRLLEKLGIPYAIGGSLASAIHGVVRSTMDVDIVAKIEAKHVQRWAIPATEARRELLGLVRRGEALELGEPGSPHQRGWLHSLFVTAYFRSGSGKPTTYTSSRPRVA